MKFCKLTESATEEEIKKSYKLLALKYHPDKNNGSKFCENKFIEILEAKDILLNPETKIDYDYKLKYGEFSIFIDLDLVDHYDYLYGLEYYDEIHNIYHKIPNNYKFKTNKIFKYENFGYFDEENNMYGDLYLKVNIKNYSESNFINNEKEIRYEKKRFLLKIKNILYNSIFEILFWGFIILIIIIILF